MTTLPSSESGIKHSFETIPRSFLHPPGLAFSSVLNAASIRRAFEQEGECFADDAIFSTEIVLWAFLAQTLRDGKGAACAAAIADIATHRAEQDCNGPNFSIFSYFFSPEYATTWKIGGIVGIEEWVCDPARHVGSKMPVNNFNFLGSGCAGLRSRKMKTWCILGSLLFVLPMTVFSQTTIQDTEGINTLVIKAGEEKVTISPDIYGHFAEHLGRCIYDGIWVGPDSTIPNVRGIRTDIVEALKNISIPVLRWPGGCFADEYHWKDGIGPREKRPRIVNTHWGMVVEDNSFGTHEFMDLCEQIGCEAYIAGNVGSGTPKDLIDWVEYLTFDGDSSMANLRKQNGREKPWKIKYIGIGNENWGCGGNMTPEYYADLYKRYQTFVENYPGSRIKKVACGPVGKDTRWMDVVLSKAGTRMQGIGVHYYVPGGGGKRGTAREFNEDGWFNLMNKTVQVQDVLRDQISVMDKCDPKHRIEMYVDEWGTWWDSEPGSKPGFLYQQNTVRDAVSAGIFLNEFNNHAHRVKMANIAQTVNVLQAMILTEGPKMLLTPTYHVFEMYKVHQNAELLNNNLVCNAYEKDGTKLPSLNVSASKGKGGVIYVSICNLDPTTPAELNCTIAGEKVTNVTGRVLTSDTMNAHNTFESPNTVQPADLKGIEVREGQILATLPSKSVTVFEISTVQNQ